MVKFIKKIKKIVKKKIKSKRCNYIIGRIIEDKIHITLKNGDKKHQIIKIMRKIHKKKLKFKNKKRN